MKCPHCGEYNPEDAVYCGFCGGQMLFVCPKCEAINGIARFYCGRCGAELKAAAPQSVHPTNAIDKFLATLTDENPGPQRPSPEAARRRIHQEEDRARRAKQRTETAKDVISLIFVLFVILVIISILWSIVDLFI